jgi:hypothetical protein
VGVCDIGFKMQEMRQEFLGIPELFRPGGFKGRHRHGLPGADIRLRVTIVRSEHTDVHSQLRQRLHQPANALEQASGVTRDRPGQIGGANQKTKLKTES